MIGLTTDLRTAIFAGGSAFGASLLLTPLVRALAVRLGFISKPVEDRWGKRIIARLGGVAMFAGFTLATLIWLPLTRPVVAILLGATLVFALGLTDDLRRMPPYTKLVFQLLIGCVIAGLGIRVEIVPWPWMSAPLSVLWFVLVMNAFNLLDNMDGLAAGIGAIAASACALHAVFAQHWTLVALDLSLCGVCLGFLRYNFPPAKIYMGDSGSHFLGLVLAALTPLSNWYESTHLLGILLLPALVLAVPIFDTCFVTIQRLAHRRHPFTGGTDHVSHRLAILGLSERQTVLALYAASAGFGAIGIACAALKPLSALALWGVVLTALVLLGCYLAQVNVYRLEDQRTPVTPARLMEQVTVVDTMLLHKRRLLEILIDFCLISSAYVFAHLLRFEGALSSHLQHLIVQSLPLILAIKLACFAGSGLYLRVWRYPDLSDVLSIFKAVTLGSILSSLALLYCWRFDGYSRAVFIIDWMLSFLAVAGSRIAERALNEWIGAATEQGVPVVIIGAGETGERVLRYLKYGGKPSRRVIGFLDDDPRKSGARIHGFRVLGGRSRLLDVLERHQVRDVLIAIADPPGDLLEHVRACCEPRGVTWRVVTAGVTGALD